MYELQKVGNIWHVKTKGGSSVVGTVRRENGKRFFRARDTSVELEVSDMIYIGHLMRGLK